MGFLVALVFSGAVAAEPVAVRYAEGMAHGFLALRTPEKGFVASGDLLQVVRRGAVESRMVFHFKDGSLLDETVVFTQDRVFNLQSYRLLQKGPVFSEDSDISMERKSGKYTLN